MARCGTNFLRTLLIHDWINRRIELENRKHNVELKLDISCVIWESHRVRRLCSSESRPFWSEFQMVQQVIPVHSRMETFSESIHCANDRFFRREQMFARRDLLVLHFYSPPLFHVPTRRVCVIANVPCLVYIVDPNTFYTKWHALDSKVLIVNRSTCPGMNRLFCGCTRKDNYKIEQKDNRCRENGQRM